MAELTLADIRKLLLAKKLVIGAVQTIAGIRTGVISRVVVASNCDKRTLNTLVQYQKIGGFDFVRLGVSNDELGVTCKKQFGISVLGILK